MAKVLEMPTTLAQALRLAADLAEQNEELWQQLKKLESSRYPDVLLSKHILELMGWSKATLSQAAKDPTFPHLDAARKKGDAIRCLKWDFFDWLKARSRREEQ
ncbi:hypothetical protein RQP50_27705 [Paenibacillus sp. chi10]|uniref:Uncharacterized protein n=1 Tax=Paenibacillus suaedae TaxID=3077233 RepID=A0AAJ2K0V9_9BACL|nr:hypothetical protein [Paenibacillus sp. chi10]MDT8980021.1 hypothetical protein [Paenibacillus sp. chi10]